MDELTWTCHVCHERRPDARISVFSKDISAEYDLPEGSIKENIRYCNDREACVNGASKVNFTKEVKDPS